ncbi:hypothetical protein AC230_12465 [Streptomyces caatingaensis]|uniref:Uncharacterized protein n=1 Tax=Streptomyces caatingaensis TaxID=1678637 RepID=A0A0K9XGH3_9ACTN|nr:hypothetical protein AC230_12465 [Streptomyces caatingaensis]
MRSGLRDRCGDFGTGPRVEDGGAEKDFSVRPATASRAKRIGWCPVTAACTMPSTSRSRSAPAVIRRKSREEVDGGEGDAAGVGLTPSGHGPRRPAAAARRVRAVGAGAGASGWFVLALSRWLRAGRVPTRRPAEEDVVLHRTATSTSAPPPVC